MLALVLKLTLAPALVAAATRVARRVGPRAGGLLAGLPIVAGPIVVIYAVENGEAFAEEAAAAGVLGVISAVAFCTAYALTAKRAGAAASLAAGSAAFAASTAVLSLVEPPLAVSAAITFAVVGAASALLARIAPPAPEMRPVSDLLAFFVVLAALLGPLSGAAAFGLATVAALASWAVLVVATGALR